MFIVRAALIFVTVSSFLQLLFQIQQETYQERAIDVGHLNDDIMTSQTFSVTSHEFTSQRFDQEKEDETYSERGIDVVSESKPKNRFSNDEKRFAQTAVNLSKNTQAVTTNGHSKLPVKIPKHPKVKPSRDSPEVTQEDSLLPLNLPGFRPITENHLHPVLERNLRHNKRDVTSTQVMMSSGYK